MRFKAVFFDRDNTLTRGDPNVISAVRKLICEWSNDPALPTGEEQTLAFQRADYSGHEYWDVEDEKDFYRRMYRELLKLRGVNEKLDERADALIEMSWCKERELFPEVIETLEYFKSEGYMMGVISDTSLSLKATLEGVGIAHYFKSFIYSDLVGVMKPDPLIYLAAMSSFKVYAEECLYVDDYDVEADGARAMGMTAFHIDRTGGDDSEWGITSLLDMVEYARKHP